MAAFDWPPSLLVYVLHAVSASSAAAATPIASSLVIFIGFPFAVGASGRGCVSSGVLVPAAAC